MGGVKGKEEGGIEKKKRNEKGRVDSREGEKGKGKEKGI